MGHYTEKPRFRAKAMFFLNIAKNGQSSGWHLITGISGFESSKSKMSTGIRTG
jgi:hypothetical protein